MSRVVLILPISTYRTPDFVEAARTLQAEIIVASEGEQAMDAEMGDGFLSIDPRRPEWSARRIIELGEHDPVDAVVPVDDRGVLIAARAAAQLGLPHNSPEAVAATRDKAKMRTLFLDRGVPQPRFQIVEPGDSAASAAAEIGFPCVMKPVSLSASRGVIRVDDRAAAETAAARISRITTAAGENGDALLLVEEFVPGAEVALEGLLTGGDLNVLAIFDKPVPLEGPYFEETLLVTPSRHPAAIQASLIAVTRSAIAALGLGEGPIHAELRIDGNAVRMIEIAARSIGGLCGRSLRFGLLGANLETMLLRHALGFPSGRYEPQAAASGVMMLPIPKAGTLVGVAGQDAALGVPGVVELELTIPVGHRVVPLPEGDRYLGFLFARGGTPHEVEQALRRGFAELEIDIEEGPPGESASDPPDC